MSRCAPPRRAKVDAAHAGASPAFDRGRARWDPRKWKPGCPVVVPFPGDQRPGRLGERVRRVARRDQHEPGTLSAYSRHARLTVFTS